MSVLELLTWSGRWRGREEPICRSGLTIRRWRVSERVSVRAGAECSRVRVRERVSGRAGAECSCVWVSERVSVRAGAECSCVRVRCWWAIERVVPWATVSGAWVPKMSSSVRVLRPSRVRWKRARIGRREIECVPRVSRVGIRLPVLPLVFGMDERSEVDLPGKLPVAHASVLVIAWLGGIALISVSSSSSVARTGSASASSSTRLLSPGGALAIRLTICLSAQIFEIPSCLSSSSSSDRGRRLGRRVCLSCSLAIFAILCSIRVCRCPREVVLRWIERWRAPQTCFSALLVWSWSGHFRLDLILEFDESSRGCLRWSWGYIDRSVLGRWLYRWRCWIRTASWYWAGVLTPCGLRALSSVAVLCILDELWSSASQLLCSFERLFWLQNSEFDERFVHRTDDLKLHIVGHISWNVELMQLSAIRVDF